MTDDPTQPQGGPSNPPQGGYPNQPQGGYPNQPQGGYPNQPQGGYQNQPQGGYQQPQGGYQQPQGGYQQPGYQPQGAYQQGGYQQGGYAPQQPKKSNTGLIIGLVTALAVIVAGVLIYYFYFMKDTPATPGPAPVVTTMPTTKAPVEPTEEPTEEPTVEPTEAPTVAPTQGTGGIATMKLPAQIGNFTKVTGEDGGLVHAYVDRSAGNSFSVVLTRGLKAEMLQTQFVEPTQKGNLICGVPKKNTSNVAGMCAYNVSDGAVLVTVKNGDLNTVAEVANLVIQATS